MTTPSATTNPLKNSFDTAKPETIADLFRIIALGDVLRDQLPQVLRKQLPVSDPAQLGTLQSFGCPAKGAPAASILRARAWRGTTTPAELTIEAYGATPGSGQIAVAPNGDIVVLAADAWLDVDVTYMPERGDVVVLPPLPVATGLLTLPKTVLDASGNRMAILLLSAVVTAVSSGTALGAKNVLVPAGTIGATALPATGKAQMTLDGLGVQFNNATDHVSQAQVTLFVVSANDLDTLLESASNIM
jgi:hypothetical protein